MQEKYLLNDLKEIVKMINDICGINCIIPYIWDFYLPLDNSLRKYYLRLHPKINSRLNKKENYEFITSEKKH